MKRIKGFLSLVVVVAILLASTLSAQAIGFQAEEIYNSVFVVYSGNSLGSGFALGKNCIITNAHVIADRRDVSIQTYNNEEYPATILGMDEDQDIAVLIVEDGDFPYLPVADLSAIGIGDDVYAIGAPKSMAYTLTKGVVSAKEREIGGYRYVQIDAPINEGNSGGPTLNDAGEVVGMNTMKMTDSEGLGLAIPIDVICQYLLDLGIVLDDSGNIPGDIESPTNAPAFPFTEDPQPGEDPEAEQETTPEKPDRRDDEPDKSEDEESDTDPEKLPLVAYAAMVVAIVSLLGNVVLLALWINQKKKNAVLSYDPRERTDFDIDIWE